MSAKIAHHPHHPPITQIAEDARRHLGPVQRAMSAARIADREGSPQNIELVEMFEISGDAFYSARTILQQGSDEELQLAANNDLPLTLVAREIRKGIPPSERSRTKPRVNTRRGKLSAKVHARLAEEQGRKRVRTPRLATIPVAKPTVAVPTVAVPAVAVPAVAEPVEPAAEAPPPPAPPAPLPAPPPAPPTMCLAIDILIKASREMTPEAAAVELGKQLGIDYAQTAYSNLVLWMVDVSDVIDRMAARVRDR